MDDSWRGYHLSGGHVALDLTNTVSWRGDPARRLDRLDLPGFLPRWLRSTGVGEPADDLAPVLPRVRALRELVYTLLADERPAESALTDFGALLAAAHVRAVATPSLPVRWDVPVAAAADVPHALVLRTDELLRSPDATRVHRCAGRGCDWLFIDTTRNQSRRWCRTSDCGNRERARRHHDRHRSGT